MKRILFLAVFIAAMVVWCSSGFATQETIGPTGSPWTSDAIGSLSGYFINNGGTAYTLDVTAGFSNIFTANNGVNYLLPAVTTNNANLSNIVFSSNSNVYGTIGTGAAFADIALTGTTSVNFDGTVNTTTMHVATGTADFKSGTNSNNAAVTFTGDGTVTLDANTTVIGAITNGTTQQGTLNLNSASKLDGAVGGTTGLKAINVGVAPGTPGSPISATITGAVNTYLINLYNNILNISGALTVAPSGVIDTTVYSGTDYGRVVTAGAVTIGTGTVINELIVGTAPVIAATGATGIVSNYTAPITVAVTIGGGGILTPNANMTVGSLNGSGGINLNPSGTSYTLTTGSFNDPTDTYSGVISGVSGGFTKVGTGTQILTGTNTYTGTTTVDSGTLDLDFSASGAPANNIIASGSPPGA